MYGNDRNQILIHPAGGLQQLDSQQQNIFTSQYAISSLTLLKKKKKKSDFDYTGIRAINILLH